jgi:hypothetical protein
MNYSDTRVTRRTWLCKLQAEVPFLSLQFLFLFYCPPNSGMYCIVNGKSLISANQFLN